MHTDEYEISLARELNVCDKKILAIKKTLERYEKKYELRTDIFVGKFREGGLSCQSDDFLEWLKESEALKKWETLRDKYFELFQKMKI